jgi:hypothetical protein
LFLRFHVASFISIFSAYFLDKSGLPSCCQRSSRKVQQGLLQTHRLLGHYIISIIDLVHLNCQRIVLRVVRYSTLAKRQQYCTFRRNIFFHVLKGVFVDSSQNRSERYCSWPNTRMPGGAAANLLELGLGLVRGVDRDVRWSTGAGGERCLSCRNRRVE